MERKCTKLLFLLLSLFLVACQTADQVAKENDTSRFAIIKQGKINCFPPGTKTKKGKVLHCEASAVTVAGKDIIIASDKMIPYKSPVFKLDRDQFTKKITHYPMYLLDSLISSSQKLEDISKTPDGRYILAVTAFDRVKPVNAKWDVYNRILYWPVTQPDQVKIAEISERGGISSSMSIRQRLKQYLKEDYFKVEALAVIPNNKILLGIRETGKSYDHFQYRILILSINYHFNNQKKMILGDNIETLLDFQPEPALGVPEVGISSMEYLPEEKSVYFLTSFEKKGELGAYLWRWQINNPRSKPELIKDVQGKAIYLKNKAEGLSFLDKNTMIIVYDNDRYLDKSQKQKPNQALFSIVKRKLF